MATTNQANDLTLSLFNETLLESQPTTTRSQEVHIATSCPTSTSTSAQSSSGHALPTTMKRKLSDMQDTIASHFDIIETNLKSALYDFSKNKTTEGNRTVEKCIRLNKAFENKMEFMLSKTKKDMAAVTQENYCLHKREKVLLESHSNYVEALQKENESLQKENERLKIKLNSLEKAYLSESTNVCSFNESDEDTQENNGC